MLTCREYKLAINSYPASMVSFIWFTDEKCSLYQHLATWRHKIRCHAIQKLIHLVSGVCWCIVLLECVKVKLSPQVCNSDHFGCFVATILKHRQYMSLKTD